MLLWVLSSLDWQVGAEDRAGCGQIRGPKTCQSKGCTTCWLCLARVGVQRLHAAAALSPLAAFLGCATDSPGSDKGCQKTLHECNLGFVCPCPLCLLAGAGDAAR